MEAYKSSWVLEFQALEASRQFLKILHSSGSLWNETIRKPLKAIGTTKLKRCDTQKHRQTDRLMYRVALCATNIEPFKALLINMAFRKC